MAISCSTPYKDKAADFIDFILSEYGQKNYFYGLPIRKSTLDSTMDYSEATANTHFYTSYIQLDSSLSAETAKEKVYETIEKADTLAVTDDELINLVIDTCRPYLQGDTTLEQTIRSVQSKVTIYLSEKM